MSSAARGGTLKHYFASAEQQFDAAKMGMWLFLVTEVLLFSGMFVAYAVYRVGHPEVFAHASELLDWQLGALNTVVLLTSSFTVALSIHFVQQNEKEKVIVLLLMTLLCAAAFVVVKYFEYTSKFAHGIFPGAGYEPYGKMYAEYDVPFAMQFFSIYFIMTGIHGIHVLVGMGLFGWLVSRVARGHLSSEYYTPLELTGLYWHLVDIIWIFLFPLLYLI